MSTTSQVSTWRLRELNRDKLRLSAERERRAHAPDATQFVAQTRKIPSTQPETVRRVLGKAKWFQEYVEDVSPELSMLSASLQHMPLLLMKWLYEEVRSSPARTRPNSVNMLNDRGEKKDVLYMSESTLGTYCSAAKMLLASYVTPYPGDNQIRAMCQHIDDFCRKLVMYFDLSRPMVSPNIMYVEEIRVLIEKILEYDIDNVNEADVQTILLLLVHLYTGCRTGSVLSAAQAVDAFLRWVDLMIFPQFNEAGAIVNIGSDLTLRYWKGHMFVNKMLIQYYIGGTTKRRNLLFSLPAVAFAHAFNQGIIDGPAHLESYFDKSYTSTIYPIKEEHRSRAVFCRLKPKGREIDVTGPLSTDAGGRILRKHITNAGLRLPSDPTISMYSCRKGFLTRNYLNPNVGSETTRMLAGHEQGTYTLEKVYIHPLSLINFTNLVGLRGEHATGRDPLFVRRQAHQDQPKGVDDLASTDAQLREARYARQVLEKALELGTDDWKAEHPFNKRPEQFRDYGLPDLISLFRAYNKIVKNRIAELRRLGQTGDATGSRITVPINQATRLRRIEEMQAESVITSGLERDAMHIKMMADAATDARDESQVEDTKAQIMIAEESALDGEDRESEDSAAEATALQGGDLDQGNTLPVHPDFLATYLFIKRLCAPASWPRQCRHCLEDPTVSEEQKSFMWHKSRYSDHGHDSHSEDDLPTTRFFHSPLTKCLRWLALKGMDPLQTVKDGETLICTLPHGQNSRSCGYKLTATGARNQAIFQHLHDAHLSELPSDIRKWLRAWDEHRIELRRLGTKSASAKTTTTPRHLMMHHSASPILPQPYEIIRPDTKTELAPVKHIYPSTEMLRKLLLPTYVHPAFVDPSLPMIPSVDSAGNGVEAALAKRLAELKPFIPKGLYEEDGYTIAAPIDTIISLLEDPLSEDGLKALQLAAGTL